MKALVGKYNFSDKYEINSKSRLVQEIVIYPDWKYDQDSYDADIAILVLEDATTFNQFVQPVCLPSKSDNVVTGRGVVVGWHVKDPSYRDDNYLVSFELKSPVVDDQSCFEAFPRLMTFSSSRTICSGYVRQRKGAPLESAGGGFHFLDRNSTWTIRGIVSAGLKDVIFGANLNAYSLNTNVAEFRDWITEVMEMEAIS